MKRSSATNLENHKYGATAVIFARVSSKDQEDGHSLDAQIQSGFKYAIKKDLTAESRSRY